MIEEDKRLRVLVWGGGAIGGTLAACLARAGHSVTIVDVVTAHVAAVADEKRGLHISGPILDFTIAIPAFEPRHLRGVWDVVLVAVKAHHTEAAVRQLLPHLSESGCIVSLQNGLCERVIAMLAGEARTIGCFVNFAGDWLEPGEIRYSQRGTLAIGELDGCLTPRLERLRLLFAPFEQGILVTNDIWSYLWGKLGFAVLLYATALGESSMVKLLEQRALLPLWRAVCGELYEVAVSQGMQPRGFDGFKPEAIRRTASAEHSWESIQSMLAIMRPSTKTHSGYWRDIAVRKRRTEIDAQLAPVIEIGRAAGVDCPALSALVDRIHALEDGHARQSDSALFELLYCVRESAGT